MNLPMIIPTVEPTTKPKSIYRGVENPYDNYWTPRAITIGGNWWLRDRGNFLDNFGQGADSTTCNFTDGYMPRKAVCYL